MRNRFLLGLSVLLLFSAGCQDLAVENLNNPDTLKALAEPGDVETLIAASFVDYMAAVEYCVTNMTMSTMADAHSCSWGNWGMRELSSEPRISVPNETSWRYQGDTFEPVWYNSYTGISNAADGLKAINANPDAFEREEIDTDRLKAFANFTMGITYSALAQQFDQAFLLDESVDLETDELSLVPYTEVADFAVEKLQLAIDFASGSSFEITSDEDWLWGLDVSSDDLAALARTYQARTLAYVARDPQERAAADWGRILNLLNNGVDEFVLVGDDGSVIEWKCTSYYATDGGTWSRADYRTIGPADESVCDPGDGAINCYDEWINAPLTQRVIFNVNTSDRRIVGGDGSDPTVSGSKYEYHGNAPFPAARGTYHWSSHSPLNEREYYDGGANGPMTMIHPVEVSMLKAEALLRTNGSLDVVADLINETRVANGELNPASAADGAGSASDAQNHRDGASLWAKLKHEKRIEAMLGGSGVEFFDDRGWGDLVSGTAIQFPVVGKELETLQLQNYTFGGGGPGSAPKAGAVKPH